MADVRLTATNPEDSSVVPVACDASGRLLLQELPEFDGTVEGDLYVTGKGTFAGGKSIIGNDGSAQFAQGAVDIYANGTVEFTQSVTFDGDVQVGGYTFGSNPEQGVVLNHEGNVVVARDVGPVFMGKDVTTGNTTSNIGFDGSATFKKWVQSNIDGAGRAYLGSSSSFAFQTLDASDDVTSAIAWTGAATFAGNVSSGGKSIIGNDGSAQFAAGKAGFTAEGYLWCTTRRGDTVILDATSNGLASWVEYTPTSRIDQLRDKLDANRGDTGEMPADTP